jgi:hypothetical protein
MYKKLQFVPFYTKGGLLMKTRFGFLILLLLIAAALRLAANAERSGTCATI